MLLDLHIHTAVGSPDSGLTLEHLLKQAKARGLAGVAVTDHNRQWNLEDWPEKARRAGLLLCQGLEASCREGHFLIFGLPGEWSAEKLRRLAGAGSGAPSIARLAPAARRLGAVVVAAHPRLGCYGGGTYAEPRRDGISAVEVLNGSSEGELFEFVAARSLAERHGLPMTGGSDAHGAGSIGKYATRFEESFHDTAGLVAAVRRGRFAPVALLPGTEGPPVEFHFRVLSSLWALEPTGGSWRRLNTQGEGPGPRAGASLFYDVETDTLLLAGGHDARFDWNLDLYRLDLRSLCWERLKTGGQQPPQGATTVWAFDGRRRLLYALAATDDQVDTLWELPLEVGRWRPRRLGGQLPRARPYSRAAVLPSGDIALVPGKALYAERKEVRCWFVLEPGKGRWREVPLPTEWEVHRWDGAFAGTSAGVLFVGGYRYFGETGETWLLRPEGSGGRRDEGPSKVARRGASLAEPGAEPILFGGRDSANHFFNDCFRWDASSNRWVPLPVREPRPVARAYAACSWDPKRRRLLVHGGLGVEEEPGSTEML